MKLCSCRLQYNQINQMCNHNQDSRTSSIFQSKFNTEIILIISIFDYWLSLESKIAWSHIWLSFQYQVQQVLIALKEPESPIRKSILNTVSLVNNSSDHDAHWERIKFRISEAKLTITSIRLIQNILISVSILKLTEIDTGINSWIDFIYKHSLNKPVIQLSQSSN